MTLSVGDLAVKRRVLFQSSPETSKAAGMKVDHCWGLSQWNVGNYIHVPVEAFFLWGLRLNLGLFIILSYVILSLPFISLLFYAADAVMILKHRHGTVLNVDYDGLPEGSKKQDSWHTLFS